VDRFYGTGKNFCCPEHAAQEITSGDGSGLGGGPPIDLLQDQKNAAITQIESALNQDPPVTNNELESANQGWRIEIQNADSTSDIDTIKNRVLTDITRKRQAQDPLAGLKQTATDQILAALVEEPPVEESEITNRNWEEDIKNALSESAINNIRDQVLADISNQRVKKGENKLLEGFLSQAKESQN
jgi:hypothetical protein